MANERDGSKPKDDHDADRRRVVGGFAAAAAMALLPGGGVGDARADAAALDATLPNPALCGIDHIIVVMMENRSFDHYLGWLNGANGMQAGLSYTDAQGVSHPTYPLAPNFQGCADQDPDHSHEGGLTQFNNGACNGFLLTSTDVFPIGYYRQQDLSFHGQAAPAWTTYDSYFPALMAETFPNRFYMHSAQTPILHNSEALTTTGLQAAATLPAIWDSLAAAGVSHAYYYSDLPITALYGVKYLPISQPYAAFLLACELGLLPNVSYVDPVFLGEAVGKSRDDHPFADIRSGQAFLNQIYNAVVSGPLWSRTALFITYDEWGGFFDHVPPQPAGVIPAADLAAFTADGETPSSLRGFRVPTLAISPYAQRGYVGHNLYDHTSILRMIEWRWGLQPLTVRDAQARNIAESFAFGAPNLTAPRFNVPAGSFGQICSLEGLGLGSLGSGLQHIDEMQQLQNLALSLGFSLPLGL